MSDTQTQKLFAEALAAVQLQAQREMAERMIATCFERCVSEPDARLSDKQRRCLDMCAGGFLEGYSLATDTLNSIAKKQGSSAGERH